MLHPSVEHPSVTLCPHLLAGSYGVFLSAIAPVFIIAFYIYFRDKYEKEPLVLLAKALAVGMLAVIPILFVERFLMGMMPPWEGLDAAGLSCLSGGRNNRRGI